MSVRRVLASLSASILLPLVAVPSVADAAPSSVDDVYRYLEDPGMTGEGQQPPHAMLRPYADARTAAADITAHSARSPWVSTLNGDWRLTIADRPEDVPAGFYANGYDVSGWPTASVPHTWQSDFTDHPMFRNIPEEVWPDDPPRVPRDVNPTGAYVRSFQVPREWDGRRTLLRFEGVTSGYFVWVNGEYVGYDQGGYTPAEFDVTDALRPGTNRVAVQVHRWGAGSYLEDYDQWRYSGIFRDVWLYSTPRTYLRDAYITTDLDESYVDAVLTARVSVAGPAAAGSTVRGTLLDDAGRPVVTMTGRDTLTTTVPNPRKWSADAPHLYALVLELLDAEGRVTHTTAQAVGFREVEVRDKQMLVNGERVLIKGTNRAETDPDTGRYVTRAAQRRDVRLMKSLHINAVRTSHYPSDPYFYDLANEHGLWIADEVDIETHSRENCPSDCLASRPEWQAAFADRFEAMVQRDKNHPSVIIWDTGNEAGLGTAHHAMAAWADANEPTRLLYHQSNSPNGDAPFADVWGPRYPTPAYVESIGRSTTRPVVFGEYAHAMGNSVGNFDRFWELIRRYPSLQGGFIWDWAEANLNQPLVFTPDSSPNGIQAFLVGKPSIASGHLELSSLDDFVSTFRDPRLDFTGDAVTLDARVRPGEWAGSFPIVTKGQAYALQMRDRNTLEFGVTTVGGGWAAVAAPVPADWYGSWHQVTGVYDGASLKLLIDGAEVATAARTGALDPGLYEVNVGRNAQTQQDDLRTRLARGSIDWVRVSSGTSLALALEFERTSRRGEFASLGISLSGTDGLVGTDRYRQPETEEVAWAHAPIRFSYVDGRVTVHNEQPFGALAATLRWSLLEVDRRLRGGSQPVRLAPGQTFSFDLDALPPNPHDRQRRLRLEAVGADGLRYGWDEFAAGGRVVPGVLPAPAAGTPFLKERPGEVVVSGRGWNYRFDTATGTLRSMTADGKQLLRTGPQLDVYRPPTSNETYGWGTADREVWHDLGLDRLTTSVTGVTSSVSGGAAVVEVRSVARGSATFEIEQVMRYRIDAAGTITLDHRVTPRGSGASRLPYLPRVGVQIQVPDSMRNFAYYGKGPHETYNDRSSGAFTGVWRSTVDEEYVRYSRPQAYGNHTGARWASLHDGRRGLVVGSPTVRDIDVSVTPYDELARAEYDFQLPLVRNKGWVTLHALVGETGMGETPNSVIDEYRVSPTRTHEYTLVLRPLTGEELRADGVLDSRAPAPCPPDAALATPAGGQIRPGEPFEVTVTVAARCALADTTATLTAPAGWLVSPSSVDVGSSGTAVFTVTAPADTDFGVYDLAATVTARSGAFPVTVDARATVRAPLPASGVWVSDLPFVSTQNGWGPVERDMSNGEQPAGDGRTLSIGGVTYEKGIGAHAVSRVVVDLPAGCTSFRADVGVDDEMGNGGSVGFEVWVDGALRARSAVLTGANGAERVTADVTGGQQLELRVTDGGNGVGADHGDWAAARLLC